MEIEKIDSFQVDHTCLVPGIYVSRKDKVDENVLTTFDLRFVKPNTSDIMGTAGCHTIEHLGATFFRSHPLWRDKTIYFGPMGCRTGFYLIFSGNLEPEDIRQGVADMCEFILNYEGHISGAAECECGNWKDHDLAAAKEYVLRFYDQAVQGFSPSNTHYPQTKEKPMQKQIFISYRRNGSDAHARLFYEKLTDCGYSVFLDFETLFSGGFKQHVLKSVDNCTDFILLLPPGALDRCNDEEDLLRQEIVRALKAKKNIIPIFLNGFKMPNADELDDEIRELANHNGFDCDMQYFNAVLDKLIKYLKSDPVDGSLVDMIEKIKHRVLSLSHGYFRKWAYFKLGEFLANNESFFDGIIETNPHADDTFGISGLEFTEHSLKGLSCVDDFWKDPFTNKYLNVQANLVKEKNVSVQRIFIVDGNMDNAIEQMRFQQSLGFEVYYIQKDNKFMDPEWLREDYLIQDERLLVEITCQTHKFEKKDCMDEHITMDPVKVRLKCERFQRILERATPFEQGALPLTRKGED